MKPAWPVRTGESEGSEEQEMAATRVQEVVIQVELDDHGDCWTDYGTVLVPVPEGATDEDELDEDLLDAAIGWWRLTNWPGIPFITVIDYQSEGSVRPATPEEEDAIKRYG